MIANNIKRFYKQGNITDCVYFVVQDGKVRKLKASNGDLLWTSSSLGTNYNYALATDPSGYVYGGGSANIVRKIDPSDGSFVWSKDLGQTIRWIYCDSNGYVYVAYESGFACRLNPSNGNIVWTSSDYGNYSNGICCDENYVYLAVDTSIKRLSISNGSLVSSSFAAMSVTMPAGGTVSIGSSSNKIAFGGNTSTLKIYDTGDHSNIDVSVGDHINNAVCAYGSDYMYVNPYNAYVKKINVSDGSIVWTSSKIATYGYGATVDEDGYVYVGGRDGKIRKLNPSNGSVIWTTPSYQATTYECVLTTPYCSSW